MTLAGPIRLRVLPSLFPREVELQATATHIQWRYVDSLIWTDLISLADLAAPAREWAINPEDDPVSIEAGGDGVTEFSAFHWASKAADFAALALNNFAVDTFIGTGVQVDFVLSFNPGSRNNCFITVDGAYQYKSTYSVSGVTLTFTEAPLVDAVIEVTYGSSITVGQPSAGSVGQAQLSFTLTNFMLTLLDDANASAALTTLGVSAFMKTLLDDPDAPTAQTTLGVSAFVKTLLDDASAAVARTTLGAAPLDAPSFTTSVTLPGDPSAALQAATKQYVDGVAVNLGKRARVRAATTANITIATALNNADALDGVALATGDLVLVKSQTAPAENGVYVVGVTPVRAGEFDTYNEHPGSLIAVAEGTANADTLWLCTSNDGGTLNTTAIVFTKIAVDMVAANNHPGYVVGNWYQPWPDGVGGGLTWPTATIRLLPFFIPYRVEISDLAARVTTLMAGGNFQLAIYASDPTTKRPTGNALAVTASISTAAANAVSADITGANVILGAGMYWMAINMDATAGGTAAFQTTGTFGSAYWLGSATLANVSSSATNDMIALSIAQAYGTWPSLTGAGFTEDTTFGHGAVMYKVSAVF